jgi:WD40 repeat protein
VEEYGGFWIITSSASANTLNSQQHASKHPLQVEMDLLGDIGQEDQLTSTRAENAVLRQKVAELKLSVQNLTLEKAALQAEVEEYRVAAASVTAANTINPSTPTEQLSALSLKPPSGVTTVESNHDVVRQSSGRATANANAYCSVPEMVWTNVHDAVNPVCVTLSTDATLVIVGAANGALTVMQWGGYGSHQDANAKDAPLFMEGLGQNSDCNVKKYSATVVLDAPVVSVASVDIRRGVVVIAAGLMNGRVVLVTVSTRLVLTLSVQDSSLSQPPRHSKYVTALAWGNSLHNDTVWLASSSADGTIHVSTVVPQSRENDEDDDAMMTQIAATHCKSLHFDEAVPCLCWCQGTIYAYVRGTPHLTCIQLPTDSSSSLQDYVITKLHLNAHPLDDHVSFAVLQLQPSPNGRFLAAATDANRHVIIDVSLPQASRIVQNLYDHDADAYSSPKVAWSTNGLYLYSNTQHDARLLVYEIASGRVVATLNDMATTPSSAPNATASTAAVVASLPVHVRPIKDLYSATTQTNMVVTISFDRNLVAWFPPPHLTE